MNTHDSVVTENVIIDVMLKVMSLGDTSDRSTTRLHSNTRELDRSSLDDVPNRYDRVDNLSSGSS